MLCTMEGKIKLVEGPAEIADQLVEKIKVTIFTPNALTTNYHYSYKYKLVLY
jgi:hypothetical protein